MKIQRFYRFYRQKKNILKKLSQLKRERKKREEEKKRQLELESQLNNKENINLENTGDISVDRANKNSSSTKLPDLNQDLSISMKGSLAGKNFVFKVRYFPK